MLLHKSFAKFFLLVLYTCFLCIGQINAQNDLPSPTANMELIPVGSLVIPMDNSLQASPGYFNLMAYGLVNQLLQNNIPVKWAIKAGKTKDGVDFGGMAQRIRPSVQFPNWFDFRSGPFIVDSSYASAAKTLAASFGGNVTLYQLVADLSIDIRYTLNFKPKIAICSNGGNQNIHLNALTAAGMNNSSWVTVIPAAQVVPYCGYTIVSEPHWDTSGDTAHTRAVYRYVKNGGNFFAQCRGVRTYENADTVHTTTGIIITSGSTLAYFNADLAIMQFDGNIINPGGSLQYWDKVGAGVFRSTTYAGIRTSSAPVYQFMNGAKIISNTVAGGNVFYLGGHDYNATTTNGEINGRRIYLNSIFIPPNPLAWCSTLPVNLLHFQGVVEQEHVLLRWATASEEINDHFIIERSSDAVEYSTIGTMSGSGTKSEVSFYSMIDKKPLNGIIYYRLSQVDYDGKMEVFNPIVVRFQKQELKYLVYPNPAVDGINILAKENANMSYTLELSDACTKTHLVQNVVPDKLKNDYFWKFPEGIHSGVYTLRICDETDEQVIKLLITSQKP